MIFGNWTVIKKVKKDVYLCKCTCGLRKRLNIENLLDSSNNKCNHSVPNRKDLSNKTFGMWEVINSINAISSRHALYYHYMYKRDIWYNT